MQNAASALCVVLALPLAGTAAQQPEEAPAERAYHNVQVLKGLPKSQLITTMFVIRASLGVSCDQCHSDAGFDKDEKAPKQRAREMMRMVRQLNETQFGGRPAISCNTCHRGRLTPDADLAFAPITTEQPEPAKPAEPLPTAAQLFDRHLKSVGGEAAVKRITSRRMKGTRFSSEGWSSPVEIDEEAPNKRISRFSLQVEFISAYDGLHGWNHDDQGYHDVGGKELAELQQDADFYRDLTLHEVFRNAQTSGREKIDGRDVYAVKATTADGAARILCFDAATGLLARIAAADRSAFGPLPHVVDYSDYRDVDGTKVPFSIGHLRPDFSMVDRLTTIEQNVVLPHDRFQKPATGR